MVDYREEEIVIIGLGRTGLSCVDFFLKRNVIPRVMDINFSPLGMNKLPANLPYYLGDLNKQWLLNATLIIVSPGIALSHPALFAAAKAGIKIISDIELFSREEPSKVIAITGSNGKSTVTQMVGKIATNANWQVGIGGNIGIPALMLLDRPCQLYVLELSSFQLETTYNLKTVAATILNISEDHMDRYPLGLHQYRAAKLKIYHNSEVCIVNKEDPLTMLMCKKNTRCISFGINNGDYHLSLHKKQTWLVAYGELLLNCSEMNINGRHNYINALAALALADVVGIPRINSLAALRKFNGLAHRFELIHERNGVRWINDSKATNVGSTKAALNGLKVMGTLHLLLGGDGKSINFLPLVPWLQKKHVHLYCFGQDGYKLASLKSNTVILTETLEQAMRIIGSRVNSGDLVLLSPACSSLDQFNNFEMRGEVFTRLAREIG